MFLKAIFGNLWFIPLTQNGFWDQASHCCADGDMDRLTKQRPQLRSQVFFFFFFQLFFYFLYSLLVSVENCLFNSLSSYVQHFMYFFKPLVSFEIQKSKNAWVFLFQKRKKNKEKKTKEKEIPRIHLVDPTNQRLHQNLSKQNYLKHLTEEKRT